jgi:ABC-2 type transport system permease protein
MTMSFVIAAVILPAVIWGMAIAMPALLRAPTPQLKGALALIDTDGRFAAAAQIELAPERLAAERAARVAELEAALASTLSGPFAKRLRAELEKLRDSPLPDVALEVSVDTGDVDRLKDAARAGRLLGVARFDAAALTAERAANRYELFLAASVTRKHAEAIESALSAAVVRARAGALGVDLERARAVVAEPTAVVSTLTDTGEAQGGAMAQVLAPLAFMMLLWMSTMITGNHLLTSTIEEKASRVIEVLLSAVSPVELLGGKILGQCGVGLLLIALYGGAGATTASELGYAHLVSADRLGFLALYFLIAYFTVASAMAAIGSAVNELREAQPLLGPVTALFMVPLLAWFFISDNPNSTFATVLSFAPPFVPFTMMLRVTAVEPVPDWQIAASTAVGFATVAGLVWAAARIFRVGVLMTGKAPTLAELLRWIRVR